MQDSLFKYEIYALEKQIISLEIKNDFIKCIIYNFNDDIWQWFIYFLKSRKER